jgi:uncharacterized protein
MIALLLALKIWIGPHPIDVEVAKNQEEKAKGLMERTHLPEGQGMLFVYEKPAILSFWMKNTRIPLSIAFFDEKGVLIHTLDMKVEKGADFPVYYSAQPALYALEVPKGWFEKKGIERGAKLRPLHNLGAIEKIGRFDEILNLERAAYAAPHPGTPRTPRAKGWDRGEREFEISQNGPFCDPPWLCNGLKLSFSVE